MERYKRWSCIAFLMGLFVTGPTQAGVVAAVTQSLASSQDFVSDGLDSVIDDQVPPAGAERADNFSTATPMTLASLEWWGVYDPEVPLPADDFIVRIFNDVGGLPSASPVLEYLAVTPLRVSTGILDIAGGTIYHYMTDAVAGALLVTGQYWLSVVNVTNLSPDFAFWFWTEGQGGDGTSAAREPGQPWFSGFDFGPADFDLAFRVNQLVPDSALPNPAPILLFLSALPLLVRRSRG